MKVYEVIWYDEQEAKRIRWFSNKAEAEKFKKGQDDAYIHVLNIELTKQGVLRFLNIYVQGDHW